MLNRRQQALCIAGFVCAGICTGAGLFYACCWSTVRLIDPLRKP